MLDSNQASEGYAERDQLNVKKGVGPFLPTYAVSIGNTF